MKSDFIYVENPSDFFWDSNPQAAYITPFNELRERLPRKSSRVMNAIYLIYDPKSKFNSSKTIEADVIRDVSTNFLNDPKFPWQDYKKYIDAYKEKCITPLQKDLEEWKLEIDHRRAAIKDLSWDIAEEAKRKDAMLLSMDSFYKKYFDLEKLVKEEMADDIAGFGGIRKSRVEQLISGSR